MVKLSRNRQRQRQRQRRRRPAVIPASSQSTIIPLSQAAHMSTTLRRSVWGSLRSKKSRATFSSSRKNSNPPPPPPTPPPPLVAPKTGRTITMTALDAIGIPPPPELDHDYDYAAYSPIKTPIDPYYVFKKLRPKQEDGGFFGLPPKIKHLIYGFCFPDECRKITLSPRFATKAVFDDEYFASTWDILDPVWGALTASSALRKEVLTYFWTEYHFHLTLNPFAGRKLSPLSNVWLPEYLGIVQHLTVEIDFTRFGGSAVRYAPSFGYDCAKLEKAMTELVTGLQSRSGTLNTMSELIVLSRIYKGNRPVDGVYVVEQEVPWHPETPLLDPLCELCGILQRCRIAGFSDEYTKKILNTLFTDDSLATMIIPKDTAWPPLPLYEPPIRAPSALNAYVIVPRVEPSQPTLTRRSTYASSAVDWGLSLDRSQSFVDMFSPEMLSPSKSGESLTSNYTISSLPTKDEDEEAEDTQGCTDQCRTYQALLPPTNQFEDSPLRTSSATPRITPYFCFEADNHQKLDGFAPRSISTVKRLPARSESLAVLLNVHSPPTAFEIPNPTPRKSAIPPTMSYMNALNEQDPAFIRTIEAMQARDATPRTSRAEMDRSQDEISEKSSEESGTRCMSSLSSRSVNGARKKYLSFFGRFKGRASATA